MSFTMEKVIKMLEGEGFSLAEIESVLYEMGPIGALLGFNIAQYEEIKASLNRNRNKSGDSKKSKSRADQMADAKQNSGGNTTNVDGGNFNLRGRGSNNPGADADRNSETGTIQRLSGLRLDLTTKFGSSTSQSSRFTAAMTTIITSLFKQKGGCKLESKSKDALKNTVKSNKNAREKLLDIFINAVKRLLDSYGVPGFWVKDFFQTVGGLRQLVNELLKYDEITKYICEMVFESRNILGLFGKLIQGELTNINDDKTGLTNEDIRRDHSRPKDRHDQPDQPDNKDKKDKKDEKSRPNEIYLVDRGAYINLAEILALSGLNMFDNTTPAGIALIAQAVLDLKRTTVKALVAYLLGFLTAAENAFDMEFMITDAINTVWERTHDIWHDWNNRNDDGKGDDDDKDDDDKGDDDDKDDDQSDQTDQTAPIIPPNAPIPNVARPPIEMALRAVSNRSGNYIEGKAERVVMRRRLAAATTVATIAGVIASMLGMTLKDVLDMITGLGPPPLPPINPPNEDPPDGPGNDPPPLPPGGDKPPLPPGKDPNDPGKNPNFPDLPDGHPENGHQDANDPEKMPTILIPQVENLQDIIDKQVNLAQFERTKDNGLINKEDDSRYYDAFMPESYMPKEVVFNYGSDCKFIPIIHNNSVFMDAFDNRAFQNGLTETMPLNSSNNIDFMEATQDLYYPNIAQRYYQKMRL